MISYSRQILTERVNHVSRAKLTKNWGNSGLLEALPADQKDELALVLEKAAEKIIFSGNSLSALEGVIILPIIRRIWYNAHTHREKNIFIPIDLKKILGTIKKIVGENTIQDMEPLCTGYFASAKVDWETELCDTAAKKYVESFLP